jgi:hypothetical protein
VTRATRGAPITALSRRLRDDLLKQLERDGARHDPSVHKERRSSPDAEPLCNRVVPLDATRISGSSHSD